MLAHLGAMLAHRGAMLAYLGARLTHFGAMLVHFGAMLARLRAMLAHLGGYVGPSWGLCWLISSHKAGKTGEAKNTVKRRISGGSAAGAEPPLSYGEERMPYGNATASWGLGAPGRI